MIAQAVGEKKFGQLSQSVDMVLVFYFPNSVLKNILTFKNKVHLHISSSLQEYVFGWWSRWNFDWSVVLMVRDTFSMSMFGVLTLLDYILSPAQSHTIHCGCVCGLKNSIFF